MSSHFCLLVAFLFVSLLPAASPAAGRRPNILFAIADDQSFPHAGAYGTAWVETPGFDRVAREGVLFTRCYTPNAKCAPSRSCIVTGRNPWQLEEAANHYPNFPAKFKTYTEALGENGYFVGKTGKGWGPGFAGTHPDGSNRQLVGPGFDRRKAKPPTSAISNNDYAANFDDFLAAAPEGEPWCFWYGATEPHRAYEYGSGVAIGGKSLDQIDAVPKFWPDNETVRNDMLDYALEIEHFDAHLVRMLDKLATEGLLANTLVVVTADNGMPFPRVKGSEYEMSNHLPLAVMWPEGITRPGRVVDDYVSFIDFAPTFLEVAGLTTETAGMQPSPGHSLSDIFRSERSGTVNPERDHVLIGKERHDIGRPHDWGYPIRGIVRDNTLFLRNYETGRWPQGNPETGYLNTDGGATKTVVLEGRQEPATSRFWELCFGKRPAAEMFALGDDSDCVTNVANDPAFAERRAAMEEQMVAELTAQGDPRMSGKGRIFDEYLYSDPRMRDFHGRYMNGEPLKAGWVSPTDFEKEPLE